MIDAILGSCPLRLPLAALRQPTRRPKRRVRAAVHRAVEELLADEANELLTIPVVAARAGVHATTVYRRWGAIADLLADVATSRFTGYVVVPDTGSLRGDLERYASDLAKDLSDPDTLALVRATIGAAGEQGAAACSAERAEALQSILERDQARGNQTPTLEQTTDAVLAPLLPGRLHRPAPHPEWALSRVTAAAELTRPQGAFARIGQGVESHHHRGQREPDRHRRCQRGGSLADSRVVVVASGRHLLRCRLDRLGGPRRTGCVVRRDDGQVIVRAGQGANSAWSMRAAPRQASPFPAGDCGAWVLRPCIPGHLIGTRPCSRSTCRANLAVRKP
ncbi:TetR-like C-terminal domain-containing protein [Streptomyces sp. M19]